LVRSPGTDNGKRERMASHGYDEKLSKLTADTDVLAKLGKKQVLKRRFGFWSLLAFAICESRTSSVIPYLYERAEDANYIAQAS
jgi:hypothetical protein